MATTRDWVIEEFHGTWKGARRFSTIETAAKAVNRVESETYLHLRVVFKPAFYIGGREYDYCDSVYERCIRGNDTFS